MTSMYVIFDSEDVDGLVDLGISRVIVEVSSGGTVLREIGFDGSNKVAYCFPGAGAFGKHGLFDNQTITTSQLRSDLSPEEFEAFFEGKR